VGEAWARGELDIHEEHLFSELVQAQLRRVLDELNPQAGRPRLLLTTPSGEPHGLGLLMVAALASLEGAYCLSLGPQTPMQDIRAAAEARHMDIVALSISSTFPARRVMPTLVQLRERLPETIPLWVGGEGADRSARAGPGIVILDGLQALPAALAEWRQGPLNKGTQND
jgi:methanogenic corrinoid protein MtbC1